MKNILFITAFPPNDRSGGQTFTLNLLKDLSNKYTIDLIYFNYKEHVVNSNLNINTIKSFDANNLNCLYNISIHPIFTRRFNTLILKYLNSISSKYDILFFDYTQTGIYSLYIEHSYKVIRCHDVMVQKFSRKNKIFKYWVKSTERKILKSVKKIFVLSNKDADIIKKEYYLNAYFTSEFIKNFNFYNYIKKDRIFIFFGLWSRPENTEGLIWFIKKVIPYIKKDSEIKINIIGSGLSEKLKKRYIQTNKNIEYLGFVENPLDIIYRSCALIAPLFTGAGVKIKVIDAFTTGTPVIGTEITFEGLPYVKNLVYLAYKPEEYAREIKNITFLSADEKREKANEFKLLYNSNHLTEQL